MLGTEPISKKLVFWVALAVQESCEHNQVNSKMKIKIIVPINNDIFNKEIEQAVQSFKAPDMEVDVENIDNGTKSIESRYDISINTPYVIEKAQQAVADHFDGIFITDMDMCGAEVVRELVDIPVIGGFRASAYTAMMIAQKFSIVTVLDNVIAMQIEHVRAFGIEPNFASIRAINIPVTGLTDKKTAIAKVYEESIKAIEEDGAQSIIFGCTGMIGIAQPVAQLLAAYGKPAPVIDPTFAALSYLELLIRNQLSQSRLTYFVPPDYTPPSL